MENNIDNKDNNMDNIDKNNEIITIDDLRKRYAQMIEEARTGYQEVMDRFKNTTIEKSDAFKLAIGEISALVAWEAFSEIVIEALVEGRNTLRNKVLDRIALELKKSSEEE